MSDPVSVREALEQIANHPHQAYDHPSNQSSLPNYGMGCADGHRCAANLARAALSSPDDTAIPMRERVRQYYNDHGWPDELFRMGLDEAVKFAEHFFHEGMREAGVYLMSSEEFDKFMAVMDNPPLPTPALIEAMKMHNTFRAERHIVSSPDDTVDRLAEAVAALKQIERCAASPANGFGKKETMIRLFQNIVSTALAALAKAAPPKEGTT